MKKRIGTSVGVAALTGVAAVVLSGCAAKNAGRPGAEADYVDLTPPPAVETYIEGVRAYQAGDADRAIEILTRAVEKNPDLLMAQALLGDLYRGKDDYVRASIYYENVVRLDPFSFLNYYKLGVTYQLLSRLAEAAGAYQKALVLEPADPKSNMNLGLVYLAMGRLDDAVLYLERATKFAPQNAAAWSNLGVALDKRGSVILAEAAYRKSLELDSDSVTTLLNLGANLLTQNKPREAVAIMEQAVRRSDAPLTRKRLGDALAVAQRSDEALREYELALKHDAAYFPAINEKGAVLIRQYMEGGEIDESQRRAAVELWRASLAINPQQPKVQNLIRQWEDPKFLGSN
jgi:tetratricopeptide (TPR) repeat protein